MKAAIIVDSTAYLPKALADLDNVFVVRLTTSFEDEIIEDSVNLDNQLKFLERLDQSTTTPMTSQPSVGHYYEILDQMIEAGYDTVYGITIASAISGTHDSMKAVFQQYEGKLQTYMVDTKATSIISQLLVETALELFETDLTADEIYDRLVWLANENQTYLVVDDLNYLVKGGRLSTTSAFLGSLLQIIPVLHFNEAGEIVLFEKIRSKKRVFKRMEELMDESLAKYPAGIILGGVHTDDLADVEDFLEDNRLKHPEQIETVSGMLGPVIASHLGRGGVGVAMMPKLANYPGDK